MIHQQLLLSYSLPSVGISPVAWYEAENNILDSQNSNDATAGSTTTYSAGGYSGSCFIFDGVDRNRMVTIPALNLGKTWSIEMYINPTGGGGYNHIISKGWTQYDFGALYYNYSSQNLRYWLNGGEVLTSTVNSVLHSIWTKITITRDDSDKKYRFYINDVLDSTSASSPLDYDFNTTVGIGNNSFSSGTDAPFTGLIDEIKFYDSLILTP